MLKFRQGSTDQGVAFDRELARLSALVTDMKRIRFGGPPEHLAGEAPILDHWVLAHRLIPCLAGLSTGHPRLEGENRPITTSDLWLISDDGEWARTLSRWYRLGRPADNARRES